jgi:hypothetical protein
VLLLRGCDACRAVSGGLQSGAALIGVRLDVGSLPPRSSSLTVTGCRLGGFPVRSNNVDPLVCVFIIAGPSTKLFTWGGGGGDMGGHVLRETTSRGLCGLVCPSRTSERGGEGDCVKEGGGEEGKCERESALEQLRYYSPGH